MRHRFWTLVVVAVIASRGVLVRGEETQGNEQRNDQGAVATTGDSTLAPLRAALDTGRNAYIAGRLDEAASAFREAVRLAPEKPKPHHHLAWTLMKTGHLEEAECELQEAMRLDPNCAVYPHDLALVLRQLGEMDRAIDQLQRALQLDPAFCGARYNLAGVYLDVGKFHESVEQLSTVLLKEDRPEVRLARAFALCRDGQFTAAIEDCDVILHDEPKNQGAYSIRAFSNMRRGRPEEARHDAEQTLTTGNKYDDMGYFVLGALDFVQRDTEAATDNLSKAINVDPEWPLPYVFRAMVRLQVSDNVDKVMADLDSAIRVGKTPEELDYRLDGYGWQVYKFRGLARFLSNADYDGAVDDLTQAITLNDQDPDCFALRALARCGKLDWKHGVEDFERALDIDPEHYHALLWFTVVLTACPDDSFRDGQRARELADRACELTEWQDAAAVAMLAAACSETGNFAKAAHWQTQAADLLRYPPLGNSDESAKMTELTGITIMWNSRYHWPHWPAKHDEVGARGLLERYQQHRPFHENVRLPFGENVTVERATIRR